MRGCYEPLHPRNHFFVCSRGHSYDLARSGYLNLLQPQDRKSPDAGDSRASVEARSALIARGVGRPLVDAVVSWSARLNLPGEPPVVVDLGSGSGETLGLLAAVRPIAGVGVDLSTAAATHAARRVATVRWVVANADRRLPLLDASVALVLSVHGRRNPVECRRVLDPSGFLLVAIPAPDDLIELREVVQGDAVARGRVQSLIAEHGELFTVVDRSTVRQTVALERDALLDLLRGTYRGERLSQSPRVQGLERLTVTLASDIILFAPTA